MFKKAFTLSEVLIVIAVIGAVAALTIPNISDSYKDDNTIVKLRKINNELQSAQKQALAKYGEFQRWTFESGIDTKKETYERIAEFLEVAQVGVNFPNTAVSGNSSYNLELKDGTILAFKCSGVPDAICVATDGSSSTVAGKNIFRFDMNNTAGTITPYKGTNDRATGDKLSLSDNIAGTNWAMTNGNLDYLKCADVLNWENKTSCN